MARDKDYSHMVGDARKRIQKFNSSGVYEGKFGPLNYDEQHAHLDVDLADNIELGED